MSQTERWVSVRAMAVHLGRSDVEVRKACKRGELEASLVGGTRWIIKTTEDIPEAPVCLYRFFDGDELLYVGVSSDPAQREFLHKRNSTWYKPELRREDTWHDDRSSALAAERKAISDESPRYNQNSRHSDVQLPPRGESERNVTEQDYRAFVAKPGDMEPAQRAALAEKLPQYLTREQAAELANVHVRTIDRWRRWWTQAFRASHHDRSVPDAGTIGLKTYYSRATGHDMAEQPPGDVRVSKVQLLERIGFTAPEQHREAPKTIAQASREMFG